MDYKRIVEETIVPSNMEEEKKIDKYEKLNNYTKSILPPKLYRYRECNQRNLNAFLNDELWFSNGGVVNDSFDSRIYYDENRFQEWKDHIKSQEYINTIKEQLNSIETLPKEYSLINPNSEKTLELLKELTNEHFAKFYDNIMKTVFNKFKEETDEIIRMVQSFSTFTCFSESIDSNMMWGQYADSMKGFALEYEFDKNIIHNYNDNTATCTLYKVIYNEERLDTTDYLTYLFEYKSLSKVLGQYVGNPGMVLDILFPMPDEFMATKLSLFKSVEWEYEKEWRMFFTSNQIRTSGFCHVTQKPSAVYLGAKIDDFNKKAITSIAREKEIPVYKVNVDHHSQNYGLKKKTIE